MEKFLELFNLFTPISGSNGSSARQGLRRLMLLRTITVSIGLPGLLAFQIFSDLALPLVLYTWLILTITISAGIGYWQLKSSRIISINELFCHLLIDAIILIVVLLNTGGANNPLISYLLVLLAIAATILPRAYVNVFAITCIAIYTSFLVLDLQFEQGLTTVEPGHNMQRHLVGMWAIFLVSAILIALFVTQMANAIKIREINLAQAREHAIRNEQLVAIGTLAAGTAHAREPRGHAPAPRSARGTRRSEPCTPESPRWARRPAARSRHGAAEPGGSFQWANAQRPAAATSQGCTTSRCLSQNGYLKIVIIQAWMHLCQHLCHSRGPFLGIFATAVGLFKEFLPQPWTFLRKFCHSRGPFFGICATAVDLFKKIPGCGKNS